MRRASGGGLVSPKSSPVKLQGTQRKAFWADTEMTLLPTSLSTKDVNMTRANE